MTEKIVVKKVVVGTPVKRVTAGSFSITTLGGVDVTRTESDGSILAYKSSTNAYEITNLRGDNNLTIAYDSGQNEYNFTFSNESITGNLVPATDSTFDLGDSAKKWRDLYLSGQTIHLGGLKIQDSGGEFVVKDSNNDVVLNTITLDTTKTTILDYNNTTGQFTFRDSDIAQTNIAETFHQGLTIDNGATIDSASIGNLEITGNEIRGNTVSLIADSASSSYSYLKGPGLTNNYLAWGFDKVSIYHNNSIKLDTTSYGVDITGRLNADSASITTAATIQDLTVSDSAKVVGQLTVGGNLNVTGDLVYDDMTADSATFSGSVAIGTNLSVGGNLNVAGDLVYDDMTADSATFAGTVSVGTNITSPLGRIVNLTGDSATVTNIANTQFTGSQATIDSADITVIKTTTATVTNASIDSATVTNLANTQFTGSQATFDSVNITTLNAANLTFSSASITDLTVDSAKIGGIDLTGNNLTTTGKLFYANVFSNEVDLPSATTYHGMFAHVHGTGRGYFAHGGAWHRLVDSSSTGEQQVYALYSNNARVTNAQIDSATITNLASTQLTGSQATFDSANITSLGGITGFDATSTSTLRGLFSSAGDLTYNSGTGQFTIDVEQIYSQANFDSDFLTRLQTQIDSASFDQITAEFIHTDSASFDSATITNLANTQLTASQATIDSANIGTLKFTTLTNTTSDITEGTNLYYTTARADSDAKASLLVNDTGGDGSLTYDSATGVFTYTGPSAAEVRAHLTANKGLSVTSGEFNIDSANVKGMLQAGTGVTYDSSNGLISIGQDVSTTSDVTFGKIHGDSAELHVIDFDTTISGHAPYKEGRLFYDNTHKTLNYYDDITNVVHEIGLEEHQRVFNNTGATIKKGSALYFSGNYTSGAIDVPTVGLADATNVNAYNAQGLAAGDIANNSYGHCIIAGQLTEVNTAHLSDGQNFFVSVTTPGSHQNQSPTYPNFPMCLGWVVQSGDSDNGILLVNQQNHSVNSFRVRTSAHIGSDLQVDGNLTILGSQTTVGQSNVTQGSPFYRLNEGDAIGEAGTTYSGTGLDDAFFSGHFTGTTAQTYYLRIDGVGTGAGGVDTFEVALGNDSTFQSPILTKVAITGDKQEIHSTDNISVEFGATTGHDSGDTWTGVASPVNVDTGFFTNRNTGTSGVGYTHMGLYFDVSDEKWKLLDEYDSTPTGTINVADSSFSLATLVADTFEGNLTGAVTGNASTASALANGRNFELTGQVTASAVSFDGTGNVSLVTDIAAGVIRDSDINAAAAIADTKLATISTSGKVSNSATTATDANTGSTIVARDASGNFSAGTVTLTDLNVDNVVLGDNDKIKLGDGSDLKIYHDGSNSYITDSGTGNLKIGGDNVEITTASGTKYFEGSSDIARLYNAGNQKLSTHTSGIVVTGNIILSGTVDGRDVATDGSKLDGIEASAKDDQTITAGKGLSGGGTGDVTIDIDSSNVRGMFVGGTGLTYTSGTGTFDITNSGVTAGTYGSASLVPVLVVNAQGQITSASTTSVAGVSSTSFDSGTGQFTISTADGGSFVTNVTSRFTNIPDSDFSITGNITVTGDISADSAQLGILKITNELNIENDDPVIKFQDNNASGTPYSQIEGSLGYLRFHADKGNTGTSSRIGFTVDGGADGVRITKGGASGYANVKIGGGSGSSNGAFPLHIHGNTVDRTTAAFENSNVSEFSMISLADNGDFKFRRYGQNDSDIFTISSTNKATFAGDVHADSALIGGNPASTRLLAVYDRDGNLLN